MSEFYLATNADPTHPDSLDIHDLSTYFILDGSLDISTPGRIRYTQVVQGTTPDERVANANALFRRIRQAARAEGIGQSITFTYRRGGTEYAHHDLTGEVRDPERNVRVLNAGRMAHYDLELSAYPYTRGDAVTLPIAGTIGGSTAAFLIEDVPGHIDALAQIEADDTSPTGVINLLRATVIGGEFALPTEYTPWLNASAKSGASSSSDANSLGGSYVTRTLTSTDFVDVARVVQPAGDRQQGTFDGFARVYSTGTAIGAPGSLSATIDAPDAVTTTESNYAVPQRGQSGFGVSPLGGLPSLSVSATWSDTTAPGSLLLAIASRQVSTYSDAGSMAGGGTWSLFGSVTLTSELGSEIGLHVYYQRNAAAQSGTVTWTAGSTTSTNNLHQLQLLEIINGDFLLGSTNTSSTTNTSEPTGIAPRDTRFVNEMVLAIFALVGEGTTTNPTDFWFEGYESEYGMRDMLGASWIADARDQTPPTPQVRITSTRNAFVNLNLSIKPKRTSSSSTTYQEPTPGELAVGTYPAWVRAIDAATYRGNAVAVGSTPTVTTARSAVAYSWPAVTNATAYELIIQFGTRYYVTSTSATDYTLTTLAGLSEYTDGVPPTSGALAPPPYLKARVGTLNDHALSETVPRSVPLSGDGFWELVRAFSNQSLPPIDAPLEDDWLSYAVETQARSANGQSAMVRVDGFWIVPCGAPNATAWIQGKAHGTKRRWHLESHRSGRGKPIGWLENTSTGVEAGRLTTSGSLLLPPGASIVVLAFEQAGGVHSFAAQLGNVSLVYWPRFRWEAGE